MPQPPHVSVNAERLLGAHTTSSRSCYQSTRLRTWQIAGGEDLTNEDGTRNLPAIIFAVVIGFLIFANVALVIAHTDPGLNQMEGFDVFYKDFELVSVVVFSVEYVLRFWACVESYEERFRSPFWGRIRFVRSPLVVIDLVAIAPFIFDLALPDNNRFRGATLVRVLRTFSMLRMERNFKSFARVASVLRSKGEELLVTVFIAVIMLILSSSLMYYLEQDATPNDFHSIPVSMWWAVTALTTVGYGDIYPRTELGKLLGAIVAFTGVGFFALPAGIVSSGFVELTEQEKKMARGSRRSLSSRSLLDADPPDIPTAMEMPAVVAETGHPAREGPFAPPRAHVAGEGRGVREEERLREPIRQGTPSAAEVAAPAAMAMRLGGGAGHDGKASMTMTGSESAEVMTLKAALRALAVNQPMLAATLLEERLEAVVAADAGLPPRGTTASTSD